MATVKEAVTEELKEYQLKPYPGEYLILDKATTILIAQDIYRALAFEGSVTGVELMKLIDNEMESRGYYIEGEKHDTPLISDPDLPPSTTPTIQSYTDEQIAEIIKQRDELSERYSKMLSYLLGYADALYPLWLNLKNVSDLISNTYENLKAKYGE